MSFEALTWAAKVLEEFPAEHTAMTTNVRFVLFIMANRADENGELFPSVRWIMKRTGLSETTVRAATRTVQDLGLMTKEQTRRDDGGQSSNLYRLAMSQYVLRLDAPGASGEGGVSGGAPTPARGAPRPLRVAQGPGARGAPQETKELDKRKQDSIVGLPPDPAQPKRKNGHDKVKTEQAVEILTFLNAKAGRNFKIVETNIDLIVGRLNEGATPEAMRAVIAMLVRKWKGKPEMDEYLRPSTLFGPQNFWRKYEGQVGVNEPTE